MHTLTHPVQKQLGVVSRFLPRGLPVSFSSPVWPFLPLLDELEPCGEPVHLPICLPFHASTDTQQMVSLTRYFLEPITWQESVQHSSSGHSGLSQRGADHE